MSFFQELKRRNVFRVGVAYLVASWLLLQIADVVLSLLDLPPLVGQIILLVLAFGFIPAIILAWAYELTPGGIKRDKDVASSESATRETGRTLDRIILASVALAVLLLIVDRYYLSTPSTDESAVIQTDSVEVVTEVGPSIAVLPFHNMSGNEENEYFSDGLTETLLHMLAQLPSLRVAARTSSFAFKGQNTDIREIAITLGVAHVLEGSVQRVGETVRITAQLIRAEDGFHVWSQNYDRTLEDIFAIQDEIASDVASSLSASLFGSEPLVIEGVGTSDIQAYDYYLRALDKISITTFAAMSEAEILLKKALASDPGFFEAKVALAHTYRLQYEIGSIDEAVGIAGIESIVAQLLVERPDDPSTRTLDILLRVDRKTVSGDFSDLKNLLPEIQSVLDVAPHETWMRIQAAGILGYFSKPELAIKLLEDGLLFDPLDPDLHLALASTYIALERLDDAEAILRKAQQNFPNTSGIPEYLADLSRRQGKIVEMFTWLRKATEVDPLDHEYLGDIASLLYRFGFLENGDYWGERAKALAEESPAYRKLELNRAIAVGDPEQIKELARAIIRDNVPNRGGVFSIAITQYLTYMRNEGRSQLALDELETWIPGVSEFAQPDDNANLIYRKLDLMILWKELSPPDGFQLRYDALIQALDDNGIPWRTRDWMQAYFALLVDDLETVIPATAKMLDGWSATSGVWKDFEKRLQNSSLISEPEIASRLAKFKSEEARLQQEIGIMLEQPEWAL